MGKRYKNRMILNQRGGSLMIDNSTDEEKIGLSHRSGSNIFINNFTNSELATNNKQINVINDSFETVGKDKSIFIGKTSVMRTGGSSYHLKGFITEDQLNAFSEWKDAYQDIAKLNSEFKIKRGGTGYPNGNSTDLQGTRKDNPVIDYEVTVVNNDFNGYSGVPIRKSNTDEVSQYDKVPDKGKTTPASQEKIKKEDIEKSAGSQGSNAPGVSEFGAEKSAATEDGDWEDNTDALGINDKLLEQQDILTPIEKRMGDGGDEILITKRNKVEQVGAVFNDYPSIRIDEKGRSQPLEMLVSETGTFKNHDYVPHVEEVDNSSNFPCGNDDAIVGNRFSRNVGSGGIHLKTTGSMELGGSNLKAGYKRVHLNASHGVQIGSESFLELQSLKTITLRTNRQVYIESALGVKNNAIVGGGLYVEGETYLQHVTAPLEVHQTEDTVVLGKFATDTPRTLVIGEANIGGSWFPVYANPTDDIIVNYPHSHHHNGIPMRLTKSNKDVRNFAANENINTHNNISQALPQIHERKRPKTS